MSFGLSLLVASAVFSLGSLNRDESTYVAFADLLADGRLTLRAPADLPFRPWASGVRDGRIVMKYTPPWPAALAVARTVGVSRRVVPAAVVAAATVLVAALARHVLGDRRRALLAAALFAVSPLVAFQSGTYLSYLFQLTLGLGAVVLLLAGTAGDTERRGRASALRVAGAGFLAALALFARPFDAVVFVGPFAAITLLANRRAIVPFVLGALPPGLTMLAYNAHTMGGPFSLPFTVTGGNDGFGFGRRSIFPGSSVRFTLADGLQASAANLGWLAAWAAGGPIVFVLVALGVRRVAAGPGKRALVAVGLAFPLAYVFFWGTYALVHFWKGAPSLGPFYHLPLMVPVAVFAAAGFDVACRWLAGRLSRAGGRPERTAATVLAVAMAAVTLAWLPPKLAVNRRVTATFEKAADTARAAPTPGVLLQVDRGDRGFDSWTPTLENTPGLRQPLIYAEDRGVANFALLDRFPERTFSRLTASPTAAAPRQFRLTTVVTHRAATVAVDIGVALPAGVQVTGVYAVEGTREVMRAPQAETRWLVTTGATSTPDGFAVAAATGLLAFGAEGRNPAGVTQRWEVRVPYRVLGDEVELLGPGVGFRKLGRLWGEADVTGTITERYSP